MRLSTPFAGLFYVVLAACLPQPLRPKDPRSFHLSMDVRLPGSSAELEANRHRARALAKRGSLTADLTNSGIAYTASIGVGSPPTFHTLLIDTGSSNTWVGALDPYVPTGTSSPTGQNVSVTYGTGNFNGTEVIEQLTMGNGITFTQSIGVAINASEEFTNFNVDGILGLGPTSLTIGTLSPNTNDAIPTVVDGLFGQGIISNALIGISFEPVLVDGQSTNVTGEIDFGEVDTSKTTSDVTFVPISQDPIVEGFWGVELSISLGGTELMALTPGIVDTGTTAVMLPTSVFQKYGNMTGAFFNETIQNLVVTKEQFLEIPTLTFNIGGTAFEFTQDAQAFSQSLNSQFGGEPDDVLLVVGDIGSDSGGFIMGYAALERFYSVYDTENRQVGFATTPHTNDVVNVK